VKQLFERIHHHLIPPGDARESPLDITDHAHQHQKHSFGVHVVTLSLTKSADTLADVKLILPWLLGSLGAPAAFIGWLVPLRESLSLLPQLFISAWTQQYPRRKFLWCIGSFLSGLCMVAMGAMPLLGFKGESAGLAILILLALSSLARCLCSIVIKDVKGKTIDKQLRGRVGGYATSVAGVVGIAFALGLMFNWLGDANIQALAVLLILAGIAWLLATLCYLWVPELPDTDRTVLPQSIRGSLSPFQALLQDRHFIHFLITRTLFISTALVAPFYVILANRYSAGDLTALGTLLLLTGMANLISGSVWGKLSDRSSRWTMVLAGSICGLLSLLVCAGLYWQLAFATSEWWYGAVIFTLYIGHAGVRLGRSTYLVDMANAENRANMVALCNTLIGIVLLLVGSAFALISRSSVEMAIIALGSTSLLAAVMAWKLPEVTHQPSTGYNTASS